jgi:hypothetical protein
MEEVNALEQGLGDGELSAVIEKQKIAIDALRSRVTQEQGKAIEMSALLKRQHKALRYLKEKSDALSAQCQLAEAIINIMTAEALAQNSKVARMSASLVEAQGFMEPKDFVALTH